MGGLLRLQPTAPDWGPRRAVGAGGHDDLAPEPTAPGLGEKVGAATGTKRTHRHKDNAANGESSQRDQMKGLPNCAVAHEAARADSSRQNAVRYGVPELSHGLERLLATSPLVPRTVALRDLYGITPRISTNASADKSGLSVGVSKLPA